jgi:recombinational DNA repair protein (RecF pathway)
MTLDKRMTQQGIIIRSFLPYNVHVIIFDKLHGRFSTRAPQQSRKAVVQGSLAHYHLRALGQSTVIETIETIRLPSTQLYKNLQFIHHVLEILCMFLPDHVAAYEVFNHCLLLYHEDASIITESIGSQYFFLMKLFTLLGVFPEEKIFNRFKTIHTLLPQSFEDLLSQENKIPLDVLRIWLLGCIHTHHHVNIFTTLAIY